jgi:hypothetical protein
MRRDLLRKFGLKESDIADLRRIPIDDAMWRIGHEREMHRSWADQKADFLRNEVRQNPNAPLPSEQQIVASIVHFVQPRQQTLGGMKQT